MKMTLEDFKAKLKQFAKVPQAAQLDPRVLPVHLRKLLRKMERENKRAARSATYKPNGPRECARRRRQIAARELKAQLRAIAA